MASINDFNKGCYIDGATAWVNDYNTNGLIQQDPSVTPVTTNAVFVGASDDEIIVSGTMCSIQETNGIVNVLPLDASNKGGDVEYILGNTVAGARRLYDDEKNNYWFYRNNTKIRLCKVLPGLKVFLKSSEALVAGDKITYDYTVDVGYTIKKAVADDYAFGLVVSGCSANKIAEVIFIPKEIVL